MRTIANERTEGGDRMSGVARDDGIEGGGREERAHVERAAEPTEGGG